MSKHDNVPKSDKPELLIPDPTEKPDLLAAILQQMAQQNVVTTKLMERLVALQSPTRSMDMTISEDERKSARAAEAHNGPKIRTEMVPCRSEDTGATFTAEVRYSRLVRDKVGDAIENVEMPAGKVVTLHNYKEPKEADIPQRDGGMAPTPTDTANPLIDAKGERSPHHRKWVYETFRMADTMRYVGKSLPDRVRLPVDAGST